MRIKLDIARHELPSVKILWNVAPEAVTISKLLEHVHDAIPLESDGWGVEDYAVEVNGYEALHFLNPHNILHEEDQVTIRALQTPDIRLRSVSGRYQIAASGAHLIDGIAFGKTYLKRPSRPPVHIPPRKRPRLSHDYYDENDDFTNDDEPQAKRLRIEDNLENGDEELHEPDIGDEDITPSFASDDLPNTGLLRSGRTRKSVSFDESSLSAAHDVGEKDEDEDEDEEDYEPDEDDELAELDDSDSDDDMEDLEGAEVADTPFTRTSNNLKPLANRSHKSETPVSRGFGASKSPSTSSESDSASSQSSTSDDDSDSSISSDSDSDSSEAEPEIASSKPSRSSKKIHHLATKTATRTKEAKAVPSSAAPGKGTVSTRVRNRRRRNLKRLNHLKRVGEVGPDTTLTELAEMDAGISESTELQQIDTEVGEMEFTRRRNELLESLEAGGIDKDSLAAVGPQAYPSLQNEESQPPVLTPSSSQKSPAIADSLANDSSMTGTSAPPSQPTAPLSQTNEIEPSIETQDVTDQASRQADARKSRSKLDIASSNRLIFGSLGVRAPRTKVDQDRVRERLGGKAKSKPASRKSEAAKEKANNPVQEQAEPEAKDPHAWRKKIKLMALECNTDDMKGKRLSTPPFPFNYSWNKSARKQGKKRKRGEQVFFPGEPREGEPVTPLPCHLKRYEAEARAEAEFQYSMGNGLNYDDPTEDPGSLVEASQEGDLPELSAEMAQVPALKQTDALPGAIIAFKQFEVSEATSWQPGMSGYKTASIINFDKGSSIVRLQLAKRDNPHLNREYDARGNPIYGRFEMAVDEDDDLAVNGILELDFFDLGEPKLIRAAEPADNSKSQSETETMRVPESMLQQQIQDDPPPDEAANFTQVVAQPDSLISQQSIVPSTSTAVPYAEEDLWDSTQGRLTPPSPSHLKATTQTSISVATNGSQQQSSTSQTLNYDDLRSEDPQRSPSYASATESGSHGAGAGGLVLEASA